MTRPKKMHRSFTRVATLDASLPRFGQMIDSTVLCSTTRTSPTRPRPAVLTTPPQQLRFRRFDGHAPRSSTLAAASSPSMPLLSCSYRLDRRGAEQGRERSTRRSGRVRSRAVSVAQRRRQRFAYHRPALWRTPCSRRRRGRALESQLYRRHRRIDRRPALQHRGRGAREDRPRTSHQRDGRSGHQRSAGLPDDARNCASEIVRKGASLDPAEVLKASCRASRSSRASTSTCRAAMMCADLGPKAATGNSSNARNRPSMAATERPA